MRPAPVRLVPILLLLALAACSEPAPPDMDMQASAIGRYQDPFGRRPVALELNAGARLSVAYVDAELLAESPAEQKRQAHTIAHYLWRAYAEAQGVDTVSVEFMEQESKNALRSSRTTHTFFFYPEQLRAAAPAPAGPR